MLKNNKLNWKQWIIRIDANQPNQTLWPLNNSYLILAVDNQRSQDMDCWFSSQIFLNYWPTRWVNLWSTIERLWSLISDYSEILVVNKNKKIVDLGFMTPRTEIDPSIQFCYKIVEHGSQVIEPSRFHVNLWIFSAFQPLIGNLFLSWPFFFFFFCFLKLINKSTCASLCGYISALMLMLHKLLLALFYRCSSSYHIGSFTQTCQICTKIWVIS